MNPSYPTHPHPTIQLTEGREIFSQRLPGLQTIWDSSSLSLLKECPRKYYYKMIHMWQSRKEALPLTFGTYFHSALEAYDLAKALGQTHELSLRAATKKALEISGTRDPAGNWHPWTTDDTRRNRFTLVRSVVWYFDHFAEDPTETVILKSGEPAVELTFKFDCGIPVHDGSGENYILCGHLDRLAKFGDNLYVMDRKTTTSTPGTEYFDRYSPDNQMTLYTVAAQAVFAEQAQGVLIDAVQVAVGFTRFQRGFANRTPQQLEEWLTDLVFWLSQAETFARAQHWPQNDKSCFNYGGCPFRGVCGKDPTVREVFLASDFVRREWDPLVGPQKK